MSTCTGENPEVDRIADELHAAGLARTAAARTEWRSRFTDDEFREYMRQLALKGRATRVRKAVARRRERAAQALLNEPASTRELAG